MPEVNIRECYIHLLDGRKLTVQVKVRVICIYSSDQKLPIRNKVKIGYKNIVGSRKNDLIKGKINTYRDVLKRFQRECSYNRYVLITGMFL